MSYACAARCGLLDVLDERFQATLVGVGSQQSSGKIHIASMKIGNDYFPISLTVMDKKVDNMEMLLGLDMLKRHRCSIDLEKGLLYFYNHSQQRVSTPFLHEKDLPESKGGALKNDPTLALPPVENNKSSGEQNNHPIFLELLNQGYSKEQILTNLQKCGNDYELTKTVLMFIPPANGGAGQS